MKKSALIPALLLCLAATGCTVHSVAVDTPQASVRFHVSAYPDLVLVPGLPVYYAPRLQRNYFFYDGLYWVFEGDNWYASEWYDGPWSYVRVDYVPVFILRVPVYYYRRPPVYFRSWHRQQPPRWGERWGRDWETRHPDWHRHDVAPPPAPRPDYQRHYRGRDYPAPGRQQELRRQHYGHQPRERVELGGAARPRERWQEEQEQWQQRRQQQERQERQERHGRPDQQDDQRPRPEDRGQGGDGRFQRPDAGVQRRPDPAWLPPGMRPAAGEGPRGPEWRRQAQEGESWPPQRQGRPDGRPAPEERSAQRPDSFREEREGRAAERGERVPRGGQWQGRSVPVTGPAGAEGRGWGGEGRSQGPGPQPDAREGREASGGRGGRDAGDRGPGVATPSPGAQGPALDAGSYQRPARAAEIRREAPADTAPREEVRGRASDSGDEAAPAPRGSRKARPSRELQEEAEGR